MGMTLLKWLSLALAGYAVLVAVLYLLQRQFMYQPPPVARMSPAAAEFPAAEEVALATSDGETVVAWHVPPRPGRPVVIFFHGNGEVLAWRVARFEQLVADGMGLVALSYRGYFGSTGWPSEQGLLRDAAAAYAFAVARYAADRIVLWGRSAPGRRSRWRSSGRSASSFSKRPLPRPSISRRRPFPSCRCRC